jgi:NAD(P)-dependent dehydrogenase (short-subunit alcohol dehydrogenase family)
VAADVAEPDVAASLVERYRPETLVLNAGAPPLMRPIQDHTWATFSRNWEVDVRQTLHWIREALLLPLAPRSTVIAMSSGAVLNGSPLSTDFAAHASFWDSRLEGNAQFRNAKFAENAGFWSVKFEESVGFKGPASPDTQHSVAPSSPRTPRSAVPRSLGAPVSTAPSSPSHLLSSRHLREWIPTGPLIPSGRLDGR